MNLSDVQMSKNDYPHLGFSDACLNWKSIDRLIEYFIAELIILVMCKCPKMITLILIFGDARLNWKSID
jgi:hypothetical protein